jgi:hypothetical protein
MTNEEIIGRFDERFGTIEVDGGYKIIPFSEQYTPEDYIQFILSIIQEDRKTRDAELRKDITEFFEERETDLAEYNTENPNESTQTRLYEARKNRDEVLNLLPQPQEETM